MVCNIALILTNIIAKLSSKKKLKVLARKEIKVCISCYLLMTTYFYNIQIKFVTSNLWLMLIRVIYKIWK